MAADFAVSEAVADLHVYPIASDLTVRGAFMILKCIDRNGKRRLVFAAAGDLPRYELDVELIRQVDVITHWMADEWDVQ